MHVCEEFREKITEHIIDRHDLDNDVELQRELLLCNTCLDFYAESRDVIDALSTVHFEMDEENWEAMAHRMQARIIEEHEIRTRRPWWTRLISERHIRIYGPALAGAAAMLLITIGVSRLATPVIQQVVEAPVQQSSMPAIINPDAVLDPSTADYLAQSELLLRSVMKLKPSETEDVQEAREMAGRQLVDLEQRKEAVSQVQPIVHMMDKYEMILRDIRNLQASTASEDISDIKNRIERNGLIADMRAFQPKPTLAETEQGGNQQE